MAIKRVREGDGTDGGAAALRREADQHTLVTHPRIVPVLEVLDDPPDLALVQPWMDGGSLRDLLDERGTLTAGELIAVLEPVAGALEALRMKGLVHGDLKPSNVLLTSDGEPMLADLGSVRHVGDEGGEALYATPAYLDPAASASGAPAFTSDVFSLGVLAYEALTGRLPHRGEPREMVALAAARAHRRLTEWPAISPAVAEVVEAALSPEPADRPAHADELVELLRAAVEDENEIRLPGPATSAAYRSTGDVNRPDDTIEVGPKLTRSTDEPTASRTKTSTMATLAVGALALLALRGPWSPTGEQHRVDQRESTTTVPVRVANPCGRSRAPGRSAGSPVLLSRTGNSVQCGYWDGETLTIGHGADARRFRIGRPGDQVLFGDWDGNSVASPAIYRPNEGIVLYVDRLPEHDGAAVRATTVEPAPRTGTAQVHTDDETGRDSVQVHPR